MMHVRTYYEMSLKFLKYTRTHTYDSSYTKVLLISMLFHHHLARAQLPYIYSCLMLCVCHLLPAAPPTPQLKFNITKKKSAIYTRL